MHTPGFKGATSGVRQACWCSVHCCTICSMSATTYVQPCTVTGTLPALSSMKCLGVPNIAHALSTFSWPDGETSTLQHYKCGHCVLWVLGHWAKSSQVQCLLNWATAFGLVKIRYQGLVICLPHKMTVKQVYEWKYASKTILLI